MKKRILGGLVAALFLMGLSAPAAMAEVNGVAAFSGTANVGEGFEPTDLCDKNGGTATSAEGGGLNVAPDVPLGQDVHTWSLATDFQFLGTGQMSAGLYEGSFNVCGWMDGPLPSAVGASCTSTKGYHGRGYAEAGQVLPALGDDFALKLTNVGWKLAVGAVLPVTGNYQVLTADSPTAPKKVKQEGSIVALVGAAPADTPTDLPCLLTTADTFTIAGAAVLLQDGTDRAKYDGAKKCDPAPETGHCGPVADPKK